MDTTRDRFTHTPPTNALSQSGLSALSFSLVPPVNAFRAAMYS
eukprot:CAMPEP_0175834096 /NCGR_PEP_ID=MMETSP0107_2-20121207/15870_1 /TAXON_ID=195067 ORGANISM="Goniomonas pacifica, Strain CCMP1869" /NCGR_SAMPLE_ID=MMETSP0107_2 /ASSEMBLY_ACC=CAM_ASM_000203 /LENGTH=42 /DNA_ID= /DNA_START= /DNA_END= /DNA_ORIENTATION=